MKYMGGKTRIAKHIVPIMLGSGDYQNFYDLSCGGGNLLDKIPQKYNRIGVDINPNVIEALTLIRDNPTSLPKNNTEFTEQHYNQLKQQKHSTSPMIGYCGFALSYAGKWFGGWCRDSAGKRDYVKEAYNNAQKQSPLLQNTKLICCSYDEVEILPNSIIYIDPPYKNTTSYKNSFDYEKFYKWCLETSKKHKLFISEYEMPDSFECVWQKEIVSSLTQDTGAKKGIEKLWVAKN